MHHSAQQEWNERMEKKAHFDEHIQSVSSIPFMYIIVKNISFFDEKMRKFMTVMLFAQCNVMAIKIDSWTVSSFRLEWDKMLWNPNAVPDVLFGLNDLWTFEPAENVLMLCSPIENIAKLSWRWNAWCWLPTAMTLLMISIEFQEKKLPLSQHQLNGWNADGWLTNYQKNNR